MGRLASQTGTTVVTTSLLLLLRLVFARRGLRLVAAVAALLLLLFAVYRLLLLVRLICHCDSPRVKRRRKVPARLSSARDVPDRNLLPSSATLHQLCHSRTLVRRFSNPTAASSQRIARLPNR
jgi:hypothetical protein